MEPVELCYECGELLLAEHFLKVKIQGVLKSICGLGCYVKFCMQHVPRVRSGPPPAIATTPLRQYFLYCDEKFSEFGF